MLESSLEEVFVSFRVRVCKDVNGSPLEVGGLAFPRKEDALAAGTLVRVEVLKPFGARLFGCGPRECGCGAPRFPLQWRLLWSGGDLGLGVLLRGSGGPCDEESG